MQCGSIPEACAATFEQALQRTPFMTTSNDNQIDEIELARLGIQRVQTDSFLWGGYRYNSVRDAIAAAKRGEKR
jgi:hypothetical protein